MKSWKILNKVKISSTVRLEDKQKSKIDEITKILLENRGIRTKKEIEKFFDPKIDDITVKSVNINEREIKKIIGRIKSAIKNNEKIIIFGDYDTDGICATAILWETLYQQHKNVFPYIPNRKEEGYGLTEKGIKNVLFLHPDTKLIITVDNGIVANDAVDFANKNKIDVVISDHHQKGAKIPKALAIIHTVEICGAGVAWVLAQEFKVDRSEYLELVALATVGDMVPLIGANRILLKLGLEQLKKTKRVGLLELFKEAFLDKEKIGIYEMGHIIVPRLNASGRVSHAMDSLRLLCTTNFEKAKEFAYILGKTNQERQSITEETTSHAKSIFSNSEFSKIIFVSHSEYNQGIIGLVASRLVEEYYKPSFVISIGEKYSKGSARSVRGVNIIELIRSLPQYIVEAGGHPMAAGFTVETEKIEGFRKELEKRATETIKEESLKKTLTIDLTLEFKDIDFNLYKQIEAFSPFGIGNPEPTFITEKVIIEDLRLVGIGGKHVKLRLSQGQSFDGIAFGMGEFTRKNLHVGDIVDVVYTIEKDNWRANKKLQLKIKDFKKL